MKIFRLPVLLIAAIILTVSVSAASTAQFIEIDKTTRGDWPGSYGSDGYIIITDNPSHRKIPSYARVSFENDWGDLPAFWTWWAPDFGVGEYSANNGDAKRREPGVLFTGPDKTSRVAACYYSGGIFMVNVDVGDEPKIVSLYMHDYDEQSRSANLFILDEYGSKDLTDFIELFSYDQGWYLKFQITGKVQFMIEDTSSNGMNAVLSGVFFDPGDPSLVPAAEAEEAEEEDAAAYEDEAEAETNVFDGEFFMALTLLAIIFAVLVMGCVSMVSGYVKNK